MNAADKGRAAAPAPSKASLSRRGSMAAKDRGKTAQPKTGTAHGAAPATVGKPAPAKAEAAAAAAKPHPAAAGAVPAAAGPQAAKPAADGGDAFIYEEYGFPSAAEPMPAANPLLICSVLVAYLLFVSACFLIIKYAYHGYDVNAPDVHTVTSKDLLAPIQFDPKDLEESGPPPKGSRLLASGRAGKRAKKRARSKSGRRRSTHSPWEEERVTLMATAEIDYVPDVSANSSAEDGETKSAGHRHSVNGTDGAAETSDDTVSLSTTRRAGRPKSLNKSG